MCGTVKGLNSCSQLQKQRRSFEYLGKNFKGSREKQKQTCGKANRAQPQLQRTEAKKMSAVRGGA